MKFFHPIAQIRQSIRNTRKIVSGTTQYIASAQICERIFNLDCYREAKKIAVYQATNGEINLNKLWHHSLVQGKQCYFPIMMGKNNPLSFTSADQNTLFTPNKFGILEPPKDPTPLDAHKIDIIFLPLVAFDEHCNRIGMGGGYYDRTCRLLKNSTHPPKLIGVAYEFQKQADIIPQEWDVPLDAVVTPQFIYEQTSAKILNFS